MEQYFRLGAKAGDLPYIESFTAWASGIGMSEAIQQDFIAWGLSQPPNASQESLLEGFNYFCEKRGIDATDANLIETWRDAVVEAGPLEIPPPQTATDDDKRRLAEIEAEMKLDRRDSKYWNDAAVRDEYRALLERTGIADAPTGANDTTRKSELESLLRSDRAAYFANGGAAEYSQILARETGGQPTEGVTNDTSQLAS